MQESLNCSGELSHKIKKVTILGATCPFASLFIPALRAQRGPRRNTPPKSRVGCEIFGGENYSTLVLIALTLNILLTLGGTCRLLSNLVYNPVSFPNYNEIVQIVAWVGIPIYIYRYSRYQQAEPPIND